MKVKYTSQDGWDVYSPTADAIKVAYQQSKVTKVYVTKLETA